LNDTHDAIIGGKTSYILWYVCWDVRANIVWQAKSGIYSTRNTTFPNPRPTSISETSREAYLVGDSDMEGRKRSNQMAHHIIGFSWKFHHSATRQSEYRILERMATTYQDYEGMITADCRI
jgi:hypothetical protein